MSEALGVRGVRGVERSLSRGGDDLDASVEHVARREERKGRVVMILVVPVEEVPEPRAAAGVSSSKGMQRIEVSYFAAIFSSSSEVPAQ